MGAPNMQPGSGSHLVELTLEAFRVAHRASSAAAEGIATSSKALLVSASWTRWIAISTTS